MDLINQNDTNTSRESFTENLSAISQLKKKSIYMYMVYKRFENSNKSSHEHRTDKKTLLSETTMFNHCIAGRKTWRELSNDTVTDLSVFSNVFEHGF